MPGDKYSRWICGLGREGLLCRHAENHPVLAVFAPLVLGVPLRADQVVMQNGDTLNGTVLSVTTNSLVFKNDNLGSVTLPRTNVSHLVFGAGAVRASAPVPASAGAPAASPTNAAPELAAALQGIRGQTNLIQQVQSKFLGEAGPDAVNKFNDLLDGLSTGKIDLNDLRSQARSAADQLRSLKKDLGPDAGEEMSSYLTILDSFLQETAPPKTSAGTTNAAALPKPVNAP